MLALFDVFLYGGELVTAHRRNGREHGRHAVVGVGVGHHLAVHEVDDAGGVALCKLGIVGDHDDEPVVGDFLQDVHDLFRGLRVQRARGLVGEDDVGVVDDCTRNRNPLHLTARHLVGLFAELVAETHSFECVGGELLFLLVGDTGNRERELDILQNVQVRDEVIGLENEAYRTVAVGVPVAGLEFLGGAVVDDEVAVGVTVQSADYVQQRCLAATRGSENGHEFALAEVEADALDSVHDGVRHAVILDNVDEFKHTTPHKTYRERQQARDRAHTPAKQSPQYYSEPHISRRRRESAPTPARRNTTQYKVIIRIVCAYVNEGGYYVQKFMSALARICPRARPRPRPLPALSRALLRACVRLRRPHPRVRPPSASPRPSPACASVRVCCVRKARPRRGGNSEVVNRAKRC